MCKKMGKIHLTKRENAITQKRTTKERLKMASKKRNSKTEALNAAMLNAETEQFNTKENAMSELNTTTTTEAKDILTLNTYAAILSDRELEQALPNAGRAYKSAITLQNGGEITEAEQQNIDNVASAIALAVRALQENGKNTGASSIYNMLAGRQCYGIQLFRALDAVGTSKTLAAFMGWLGYGRADNVRNSISKAGNSYVLNRGKFSK
jgi:hypothetical protein